MANHTLHLLLHLQLHMHIHMHMQLNVQLHGDMSEPPALLYAKAKVGPGC